MAGLFKLAHWDSASSKDGTVWKTDWIMQFTRRHAATPVDASSAQIEAPPSSAIDHPQTRQLDFLIGAWIGEANRLLPDGTAETGTAVARISSLIEGFGLLQFVDTSRGTKNFSALGFDPGAGRWVALQIENQNVGIHRMEGDPLDGSIEFRTILGTAPRKQSWQLQD